MHTQLLVFIFCMVEAMNVLRISYDLWLDDNLHREKFEIFLEIDIASNHKLIDVVKTRPSRNILIWINRKSNHKIFIKSIAYKYQDFTSLSLQTMRIAFSFLEEKWGLTWHNITQFRAWNIMICCGRQ